MIEDLELDAPGAGEVPVELAGAGLCHADLSTIDGSRPRPDPVVLGHEASGVVREVEPGVSGLRADANGAGALPGGARFRKGGVPRWPTWACPRTRTSP